MGKMYKGWELMKAIEDGEIKDGSRFYVYRTFNAIAVLKNKILHFEDEIYIDNIEEYNQDHTERCVDIDIRNKINELIQAVKQLDKRIKKLEGD